MIIINEENVYIPFDCVKRADPKNLLNFIKDEHPQIISLVLSHLEPKKASFILQSLTDEIQSDVSMRIASMDSVSPEIMRKIEKVLEKKLGALSREEYIASGGAKCIAKILKYKKSNFRKRFCQKLV